MHDSVHGVSDIDYHEGRQQKRALIYRLRRRTDEVERALRCYVDGPLQVVVDLGTADGLMLDELRRRLGSLFYLGIDLSFALLRVHPSEGVTKIQADASVVPLRSGVADAVIATAVIEHVSDPLAMMRECVRISRPGGLLVLTTPDPLMERVSSAIGLLKEEGHQRTLKMADLCDMASASGTQVLESRKFMFSPVGFPAEKTIERIFGPVGLNLVMANQLLVARKV